jgi:hypothetical protein
MGLGMGIKVHSHQWTHTIVLETLLIVLPQISTIPVYTAEVSPAAIRGGLVTSFQLWVAFGILIGFCSNLVFMNIGRLAWRFQLAAAFAPAIPLFVLVWFVPEYVTSSIWLRIDS